MATIIMENLKKYTLVIRNVCYFDGIKLLKQFHRNVKACNFMLF